MEQLSNGEIAFYSNMRKSFWFVIPLIVVPVLVLLFFAAVFFHTVDIYLVLVTLALFILIFGISYLSVRNTKVPPYIIVHENVLELNNKNGPVFISLQRKIGFTVTRGRFMNAQMLVLITQDFKKKPTLCWLGVLDEPERALFINTLQAKGLTYFPPDRIPTKDGKS